MEMLTRQVYVLEDQGMTCLAERATPNAHGFSLHAGLHCGAHQRKELEREVPLYTRPAIANERLKRNCAGQLVLQLNSA